MGNTTWIDPRNDRLNETLYVVCAITNPVRYAARYRLYADFEHRILTAATARHVDVKLVTIEAAYGARNHAVTQSDDSDHIQLRTGHELWHKENLLNLAIQRLPADWKYVAWVDADVNFIRPDWASATLHALQHHQVVQMWSESVDLAPNHESLKGFRSFMWCYQHPDEVDPPTGYYANRDRQMPNSFYWHPGFAWAARREALDALGGLIDWSILGGGDLFMARALVGQLNSGGLPKSLGKAGVRWMLEWQHRAERHIRRDVGYVDGLITHYWHGAKKNRRYRDRGQILTAAHFDPEVDLKRDTQGLWQLTDRSRELRDGIRAYFRQRNEDGMEI